MNLHEKILYCRKRAGLSQEELGNKIGVSRQAISKWETGESVPELGKIVLLADVFQVTTDWLLRDGDADEVNANEVGIEQENWVQSIPGVLGKMIQKYGWLVGVYLAVMGALFMATGIAGNLMFKSFFRNTPFSNQSVHFNVPGNDPLGFGSSSNPGMYITGFVIVVGAVLLIGGTILAVVLKRKGINKM